MRAALGKEHAGQAHHRIGTVMSTQSVTFPRNNCVAGLWTGSTRLLRQLLKLRSCLSHLQSLATVHAAVRV